MEVQEDDMEVQEEVVDERSVNKREGRKKCEQKRGKPCPRGTTSKKLNFFVFYFTSFNFFPNTTSILHRK